jgi:hypothetical protein
MTVKKSKKPLAPSSSPVLNRRFEEALGKVLKVSHADMKEMLKKRKDPVSSDEDSPALH